MTIKNISLVSLLLLTGCAGTVASGETRLLHEPYPDVRTVPSRAEATQKRASHEGNEVTERTRDFAELEAERALQKERDQDLRQEKMELPEIPEIPDLTQDESI